VGATKHAEQVKYPMTKQYDSQPQNYILLLQNYDDKNRCQKSFLSIVKILRKIINKLIISKKRNKILNKLLYTKDLLVILATHCLILWALPKQQNL
jgi:hypothetical protein